MVAHANVVKLTPEKKRAQTSVIQAYNDFWNQSMLTNRLPGFGADSVLFVRAAREMLGFLRRL